MTSHSSAVAGGIIYNSADEQTSDVVQLPLDKVVIDVLVVDLSARVDVIQRFYNPSKMTTSRAKYMFPVPAGAAVCAFEMHLANGRVVVGEAKDKDQARLQFDQAVAEGKRTALVDKVSGDVFTISIGPIPGEQSVTTIISYVMDLMDDRSDTEVRLLVPMSVGQRYGEAPPELLDASAPSNATRVRFNVHIQMQGSIQRISSPSHPDTIIEPYKTHFGRASKHRSRVTLRSKEFLTKDFVLTIDAVGLDRPRCFAEYDNHGAKSIAMQLTLLPKFNIPPLPSQEYIFLVDRSGSMGWEEGRRIATAKQAVTMLLRILPVRGTTFNVFSFHGPCESICKWRQSVPYGEETLRRVEKEIELIETGQGTHMDNALRIVLASRSKSLPTTIFLLTDAEVQGTIADNAEDQVRSAQQKAHPDAPLRLFVLGIGNSVSTQLCESLANAGNGGCLYATTAEKIVQKCATLIGAGRSFVVKDVTIDWGYAQELTQFDHPDAEERLLMGGQTLQQAPPKITKLYPGLRLRVFALITGLTNPVDLPQKVIIRAQRDVDGKEYTFEVPVEQVKFERENSRVHLVHTLAARQMINDLERLAMAQKISEAQSKEAIVRLGEQYGLASRYTSFVAVEETQDPCVSVVSNSLQALRHRRISKYILRDMRPQSFQQAQSPSDSLLAAAVGYAAILKDALMQTWLRTTPPSRTSMYGQRTSVHVMPGDWETAGDDETSDVSDGDTSAVDDAASAVSEESFDTMSSLVSTETCSSLLSSRTPSPALDEHARSPSPDVDVPDYEPSWSQRPPTPPPKPLADEVDEFISLGSFDGSWSPGPQFERFVGKAAVEEGRKYSVDPILWSTALAIAYLQKHMRTQPQLLAIFKDKVDEYVAEHGKNSPISFKDLVKEAKKVLST